MTRFAALSSLGLLGAGLGLANCADTTVVFGGGGTGTGTATMTGTATGTASGTASGTGTATGGGTGTGAGVGGAATGTGTGAGVGGAATGTGTGAGVGGAATGTGTGAGVGGAGTGTGTGIGGAATGGAGGGCAHDVCDYGAALEQDCSACVFQICLQDTYCCDTMWDDVCIDLADQHCSGVDCGSPTLDCDTQYDSVPSYRACAQNASSCEFGFNNWDVSCEQACADSGGECINAWDNTDGTWCDFDVALTCDYVGVAGDGYGQYNVCQCSLGCGSGPPCTAPAVCTSGFCL